VRVFEVVVEDAGWVVRDNTGAYRTCHKSRDDAVSDALRLARVNRPSRLIIKEPDGSVDIEYDYH
jgi:hypothetical protein